VRGIVIDPEMSSGCGRWGKRSQWKIVGEAGLKGGKKERSPGKEKTHVY